MPDFRNTDRLAKVHDRKAPAERRLASFGMAKTGKPKEHPNEHLRRLLKDFAAGLDRLQRANVLKDPAVLRESVRERVEKERVVAGQAGKPTSSFTPTHEQSPVALDDRSIRISAQRTSAPVSLSGFKYPVGSLRRHPGLTGADREAQRQILDRHYSSKEAAHMPSAARLAQILHADRLMKTGELKSHPQVRAWARAIRGGQRRSIADLDPAKVQDTLHAAVGGEAKAQQLLSTPAVSNLVERHRLQVQTIHQNLQTIEQRILARERALRSVRGVVTGRLRGGYGGSRSAASTASSYSHRSIQPSAVSAEFGVESPVLKESEFSTAKGRVSPAVFRGASAQLEQIRNVRGQKSLLGEQKWPVIGQTAQTYEQRPSAYNERPNAYSERSTPSTLDSAFMSSRAHSAAAGSDRHASKDAQAHSDRAEMESMLAGNEEPHLASVASSETERAQGEERDLQMPTADRHSTSHRSSTSNKTSNVFGNMSASPRQIASSLPAPITPAKMPDNEKVGSSSKKQRMELKGELTLTNQAGQQLGTARVDAEAR